MRLLAPSLLLTTLLAASAPAQQPGPLLSQDLQRARAEQAAAEREVARLDKAASRARGDAERLRAEQAAAAQAIEAAEASISTADARFRLASAFVAAHQQRLAVEQRPLSSLLAGLAVMAERPPLLVLADRGSTDELVKVRILLDSTLPVIRARTAHLAAQLSEGQRLQQSALAARADVDRSRRELVSRRERFAALEQKAIERSLAAGGEALSAGDIAISAGESIEQLQASEASGQSARALAAQLAAEPPAPPRPFRSGGGPGMPAFAYQLPSAAPVIEGLGSVNQNGVRSRGLTLATRRGEAVAAPADGTVRFAGPFRDYDGVLIVDHGGGWMSLIVNVAADLRAGQKVSRGAPVGRALGPLSVELSQNGRRISPAIIAGSSLNLSKTAKGG